MEFSSLTRRVAEFASIDPSDIAPDAKLAVHGGASSPSPVRERTARPEGPTPGEGPSAEDALTRPARRPTSPGTGEGQKAH